MPIQVNHVPFSELIQHLTVALARQQRAARAAANEFGPMVMDEINARTGRLELALGEIKAAAADAAKVVPLKK